MFSKSFYEVAVLLWFSRVSSYELVHHARLKVDVPCILFYHFPIISFWEHNGLFLSGCGSWRPDSYYMVSHNILDVEAAVSFVVPVFLPLFCISYASSLIASPSLLPSPMLSLSAVSYCLCMYAAGIIINAASPLPSSSSAHIRHARRNTVSRYAREESCLKYLLYPMSLPSAVIIFPNIQRIIHPPVFVIPVPFTTSFYRVYATTITSCHSVSLSLLSSFSYISSPIL